MSGLEIWRYIADLKFQWDPNRGGRVQLLVYTGSSRAAKALIRKVKAGRVVGRKVLLEGARSVAVAEALGLPIEIVARLKALDQTRQYKGFSLPPHILPIRDHITQQIADLWKKLGAEVRPSYITKPQTHSNKYSLAVAPPPRLSSTPPPT